MDYYLPQELLLTAAREADPCLPWPIRKDLLTRQLPVGPAGSGAAAHLVLLMLCLGGSGFAWVS